MLLLTWNKLCACFQTNQWPDVFISCKFAEKSSKASIREISSTKSKCVPPPIAGGSEAIRAGRPAVRWVPGDSLRREVCAVLLRQRHLPAVLLRVLLGGHPLTRRTRVSQTPGEGRRRPTPSHLLPLELSGRRREGERQQGSRRAGSAGVANHCTNKCTFLLLVPFCSNFAEPFS